MVVLDACRNQRLKYVKKWARGGACYLPNRFIHNGKEHKGIDALLEKLNFLYWGKIKPLTREELIRKLVSAIKSGKAEEMQLKNHFRIYVYLDSYLKGKYPKLKSKWVFSGNSKPEFQKETIEESLF